MQFFLGLCKQEDMPGVRYPRIGRKRSPMRRVIFDTKLPDGRVISYHATKGWRIAR